MAFVLALDQGTTSSRAIVFDEAGTPRASAQQEFPQHFPHEAWVEHDPEDLWRTQLQVARAALADADLGARDIAAIGITNQRETTLVWERATGRPIYKAIVWQDRRTASRCETLQARGLEALVHAKTGLVLDPYFSATKLAWILDEVPGARQRAEAGELAFGTVDSWLVWRLTGGARHVTDASNASRTLLFNLDTRAWDDELLGIFRIPRAVLPTVVTSSGVIVETAAQILGAPIPIAGLAGDQQAALYGQRCLTPGSAKNTYGTGCFLLMNVGERPVLSRQRLLTSVAWSIGDRTDYSLEGSVFTGGAVVQWLRDGLGIIESTAEVESLAARVPDAGGVVFVPALTGLGAPYWDPYARGLVIGITRATSGAHVARAALEAIAHQTADVIDAMAEDTGLRLHELRVDGGATRNALLMQIQADLLGVPVVRSKVVETTALGAARLAGIGVGVWANDSAADAAALDRFEPRIDSQRAAEERNRWRRAVDRARGWAA
jgi:glycerol kinase